MKLETLKKIYSKLRRFTKNLPVPLVELTMIQTKDPFKVLITTILSARTKDSLTIKVVPELFKEIKNLNDLKKIKQEKLEKIIHPINFYKNKAKYLKKLPIVIEKEFGGKIPKTIDQLITLPGVGRKTANLVVSVAFDEPAICVDTHVHKIINRIGLIKTKNPLETEMKLRKLLPKTMWQETNKLLVAFGQYQCIPINPKCSTCPIENECKKIIKNNKKIKK